MLNEGGNEENDGADIEIDAMSSYEQDMSMVAGAHLAMGACDHPRSAHTSFAERFRELS